MSLLSIASLRRYLVNRLRNTAFRSTGRKRSADRETLLETALQALNVARENKALVVARNGLIIDINERALHLCERNRGDLLGKEVHLALFETPAHDRWQTTLKAANGTHTIEVVRQPLGPRFQDVTVFAIRDLTERQRLDEKLEHQNMRFQAALANMCQGLCMFDADANLVVANDRYAEMYGLPREVIQPGTPFRRILELRIAMGAYVGSNPEKYIRERLAAVRERVASTKIQTLSDGRVFSISHQPLSDGGWVATHQDITDQRRSEAKIAHMALHDALTDLPNRSLLNERLEQALTHVKRGDIVATHLLDLDHFKNVNDTLGHAVGDKLLKAVAGRLRALIRETDTVARMGGDEFAIVQVALEQPADAATLATRIIEAISAPYDIDGHQVTVGTSVGIAIGPNDGVDPDQLMRNADLALYRGKSEGRGIYRFFEPGMDLELKARRALECDLRNALVEGQFELYYQPVINLGHGNITGFEALIRWIHPERGIVPPGEFIPLAEEIGLIVRIGEWAIRQACNTVAAWPDDVTVSVNISPAQFRNPGLVQAVIVALADSGLSPRRLELEITETVLLEDSEATLSTLHRLRDLGVKIAMDDFGTGYSSLSYLQSFPFDRIKIDRCFVKDLADGVGSLNIVRAVIGIAKGMHMQTTAEGVETVEQLDILRAEGCNEIQGFLIARPVPANRIVPMLHQPLLFDQSAGPLDAIA